MTEDQRAGIMISELLRRLTLIEIAASLASKLDGLRQEKKGDACSIGDETLLIKYHRKGVWDSRISEMD